MQVYSLPPERLSPEPLPEPVGPSRGNTRCSGACGSTRAPKINILKYYSLPLVSVEENTPFVVRDQFPKPAPLTTSWLASP